MCRHLLKNVYLGLFLTVLAASLSSAASAGPLTFRVTRAEAGGVNDFKQTIIVSLTVRNTSSREYIRRLNYVEAEVSGDTGSGSEACKRETYKRRIDVNCNFSPPLGPRDSKTLTVRFTRKVNPSKGWYKYRDVVVRVHRASYDRAHILPGRRK